jgi:hypothetical protein
MEEIRRAGAFLLLSINDYYSAALRTSYLNCITIPESHVFSLVTGIQFLHQLGTSRSVSLI